MSKYSRLASIEERKNIKNAKFYILLSIITLITLVFFGLPLLVKFAGFIGDLAKSDKPVEINDITPPAPPQFDEIPEFTNKEVLEISGKSENGATIEITANNHTSEILANNQSKFNFTFNLLDGENSISAKAKDKSGNESTTTQTFKVTFDNKDPELVVNSPVDGSSFFGNNQRQLTIKGTVNELVDLKINGRIVDHKEDGTFSYTSTLQEGENKFDVVATDPSGNESNTSLTVTFSL